MEVVLSVEDSAQEAIAGSVIGTVEQADEVRLVLVDLTHLKGEPDAGLFGSHGKDCLTCQNEFLSVNHTDKILAVYSIVKRLFELFALTLKYKGSRSIDLPGLTVASLPTSTIYTQPASRSTENVK